MTSTRFLFNHVNGASGKRCDIDAATRRSQTENWEIRVNQSKPTRKDVPELSNTHVIAELVPDGNTSGGSRDG